jgi:ankyrin repeat protein
LVVGKNSGAGRKYSFNTTKERNSMTKLLNSALPLVLLAGCATLDPYPRLESAIQQHRLDDAQALLKAHPRQISASDALIAAVTVGDVGAVDLFLSRGARLNVRNQEGDTPLTIAAEHSNAIMVEHLVNRGADPAYRDARAKSALDYARTWNHRDFFNERNKKLIAAYLIARESGVAITMTELIKREDAKSRSVWADGEPRGSAPVADISYPLIMRF